MLRKKYGFTTNYRDFYEILDMSSFCSRISDSDKRIVMMCNFAVMKMFETTNKVIEQGVMAKETKGFDTTSINNTYEYLREYFKKTLDRQEFEALEQECLLEYAERCIEVIGEVELLSKQKEEGHV